MILALAVVDLLRAAGAQHGPERCDPTRRLGCVQDTGILSVGLVTGT